SATTTTPRATPGSPAGAGPTARTRYEPTCARVPARVRQLATVVEGAVLRRARGRPGMGVHVPRSQPARLHRADRVADDRAGGRRHRGTRPGPRGAGGIQPGCVCGAARRRTTARARRDGAGGPAGVAGAGVRP